MDTKLYDVIMTDDQIAVENVTMQPFYSSVFLRAFFRSRSSSIKYKCYPHIETSQVTDKSIDWFLYERITGI